MTRIVLVRHGEVPGIIPERFRGRMELELTARGVSQARATARYIAQRWRPAAVYTSPLGRCVATGRQIAAACAVPAQVLQQLIDLDYGAWQWMTQEEVQVAWPSDHLRWLSSPHQVRFPNGDSLHDMAVRVAAGLRVVIDRHPRDTVVLVGHDSTNRVLLLQMLELPLSSFRVLTQDPCAVNEFDPGQRVIMRVNETAHLLGI